MAATPGKVARWLGSDQSGWLKWFLMSNWGMQVCACMVPPWVNLTTHLVKVSWVQLAPHWQLNLNPCNEGGLATFLASIVLLNPSKKGCFKQDFSETKYNHI